MFKNNKWNKRIALVMVIVMAVMMLASCQSGRTYEDVAGDESKIYVSSKEQSPVIEYTGDPIIKEVETTDPAYADTSNGGSSNDNTNDDTNGGNSDDNTNDDTNGGNTNDDTNGGNTNDDTNGGDENEDEETYDQGNFLKLISYNVRCANDGNGNDIADRAPRLEKVIKDRDPDLIGFQEVVPTWMDKYLVPAFEAEYDHVIKYRAESNKEATPIFWKREKFELMDSGYFWLSETPDAESKGWGASHYRICNWVKLKIKATGKIFLYVNTHFDFSGKCHVGSAALIATRMKAQGGWTKYPVFFTADCNMTRYEDGYNAMLENGFNDINMDLEDLNYKTGGGYHLDGHTGLQNGSPIDYCFYSASMIIPKTYQIIDEQVNGGYASDHKGLYIEMALK